MTRIPLSFGGVADLGDKLFVFSVNAFGRDETKDRLVLNVAQNGRKGPEDKQALPLSAFAIPEKTGGEVVLRR